MAVILGPRLATTALTSLLHQEADELHVYLRACSGSSDPVANLQASKGSIAAIHHPFHHYATLLL